MSFLDNPQKEFLLSEVIPETKQENKLFLKCLECGTNTNVESLKDDDFEDITCNISYERLKCPECHDSTKFKFFKNK